MITPVDVETANDKFLNLRKHYLKQQGWETSCENPMPIWLWFKTIDGKEYRLPEDVAYDMEQYIHQYEEPD